MLDLIIRRAAIVDGSGSPSFCADIGVKADRVAVLGELNGQVASMEIDGSGLTAAPGFIDIHSHSDIALPIDPRSESKVRQGVTTEVIGLCGTTLAPLSPRHRDEWIGTLELYPDSPVGEWWSFGEFLSRLGRDGLGVNVLPLVGHGAIRAAVMGLADRVPDESEMATMEELLSRCIEEGAAGLSTGLFYPPGVYADTAELIRLARLVGKAGGIYFSHIRSEGAALLEAVEEAIAVGREAHAPVEIGHLKASGHRHWGKLDRALALLERARADGLDVQADAYPYRAGSVGISALLPAWALAGGMNETLDRLRDESIREQIKLEMPEQELVSETGWDGILVAYCVERPECTGKYISDLAAEDAADPIDWTLTLVAQTSGQVEVILFSQSEENVRKTLTHPSVTIGSDGVGLSTTGPLSAGRPHPRNFGTYPRILGHYVRDEGLLTLEEAVRKMTHQPATRLRMRDRGRISPGYKADLVLFDAETVEDLGAYGEPPRYPRGIEYVVVNGRLVVAEGEHTGELPGRVLGWSDLSAA
jgi:N-acyl-D-amino-acid deacylase